MMRIKYWVNGKEGEVDNMEALPPYVDKILVYIGEYVFEIPPNSQYYIGRQGKWILTNPPKFELVGYHIMFITPDNHMQWIWIKKGDKPVILWNINLKES